jgi:uncharacterized protein YhaN
VNQRFTELTGGRYVNLSLGPTLAAQAIEAPGTTAADDVLRDLSVGRKDQLATVLRLTIAEQLKSAVVLDDHLVHTDPVALDWFRRMLGRVAASTQVIVITCRPLDYVTAEDLAAPGPQLQTTGLELVIRPWDTERAEPRRGPVAAVQGRLLP